MNKLFGFYGLIVLLSTACNGVSIPTLPVDTTIPTPIELPSTANPTPSGSATPNPSATPSTAPSPIGSTGVTNIQKLVMDQIVSVFENSTPQLQYAYISAEGDGRGYTAGRAGFTSRDGDMLELFQYYLTLNPSSPLKTFIPILQALNAAGSGSISKLSSLPVLWAQAAEDPLFRQAQDYISDQLYFQPALDRVKKLNLKTQIGILCMYDASIEHGVDGVDGVDDMISKMGNLSQYKTETALLTAFLSVRRATLLNPADHSTQAVWADSVGRVDALKAILDSGNLTLLPPIQINPFGDAFVITGN